MHQSFFQKLKSKKSRNFLKTRMIDEELREELATIRNLLAEVLVNQDILAKRINADTAIKAVQTERAVELARLRRTADKATRRIATVD
jgi:hypothetical protein